MTAFLVPQLIAVLLEKQKVKLFDGIKSLMEQSVKSTTISLFDIVGHQSWSCAEAFYIPWMSPGSGASSVASAGITFLQHEGLISLPRRPPKQPWTVVRQVDAVSLILRKMEIFHDEILRLPKYRWPSLWTGKDWRWRRYTEPLPGTSRLTLACRRQVAANGCRMLLDWTVRLENSPSFQNTSDGCLIAGYLYQSNKRYRSAPGLIKRTQSAFQKPTEDEGEHIEYGQDALFLTFIHAVTAYNHEPSRSQLLSLTIRSLLNTLKISKKFCSFAWQHTWSKFGRLYDLRYIWRIWSCPTRADERKKVSKNGIRMRVNIIPKIRGGAADCQRRYSARWR